MSHIRTIMASVWVGWQRDFGWINPLAGLSLRTVAPAASVLIATMLYKFATITTGNFSGDRLAFILVGAALYAHVAAYSWVPTMAISEGKWTNVFPQVYISPGSSPPFLAGRCLASFLSSTITSIAALAVGWFISFLAFSMKIPFIVTPTSMVLLLFALVVNILASMGLGFMLGAYTIFATKFEWALPVYVSGLLMVFSEALFPVSMLPRPLADAANALPFTNFIRAAREALIYGSLPSYFAYIGLTALGGSVFLGLGLLCFRLAETRARRLGVIDRKIH